MIREFLLAHYLAVKAAHIVFIIAWMAGMMYLPRLFVYHHQATAGGEAERFFLTMERRLLKGIISPAMTAVWLLGAAMLYADPKLLTAPWMHVKLTMAVIISGIHGYYAGAYRKFARGERPQSERFWRVMNEIPFLAMIVIVVMVIVRPF